MWNKKEYDEFYKNSSVDINSDPRRFARIAELCIGHVADIGCCFGVLADYYPGLYTGFDFSSEALKKAIESRRKDAQFIERDCSDLTDFYFSGYNTIVLTEFLEHFENDEKILDPIFAKAKPGTRLIITVPNGPRVPDPSHLRELTIPQLRKRFSPHGKVRFYNWPGADRQILMSCDLGQQNENLLSLAMIVKNEEKGLEKAVLSCIDFVDNVVIAVDTASNDKTLEIAKLYADTVKSFGFLDDFATARNYAHEGIKTKWILFLDGHEYVDKKDDLTKYLASAADGLLVSVQLESGFVFQNPRIYKNGIQFFGQVHEKQECKSTEFYPGFLVKHDRLGSQSAAAAAARDVQRDDMVPRLLSQEIKKNKKNCRALFHLGLYWQSKGEFKEALMIYAKYLRISQNKQERWFVFFQKALCLMALGRDFFAFFAAGRAETEMPERWETAKLKGLVFFHKGRFARALEYFVDSFKINKIASLYRPWARNDSVTWNLIGECFFNLRIFDKANVAFERAAELCPDPAAKDFFKKRGDLMREIFKESFKR